MFPLAVSVNGIDDDLDAGLAQAVGGVLGRGCEG